MKKGEKPKTSEMRKFRKPLKISIDPDNYEYLKENGINASRLFDRAINELRKQKPFSLVLILQNTEEYGLAEIRTQDLRRVKATSFLAPI